LKDSPNKFNPERGEVTAALELNGREREAEAGIVIGA